MKKKSSRQQHNRFLRIITIPFRAFCKARDFYVRSMMDCANRNSIGIQGTSNAPGLPRSFSASSARSNDSDDFRELVRAASARSTVDVDMIRQETRMRNGPRAMPPRSVSVAMGRIDEERPYAGDDVYDGDNSNIVVDMKNELIKYPRSKSHPVAITRVF